MARPQQHLAAVVRAHGSGDATEELREVLRRGLFALEDQKRELRIATRGTAAKQNPFVSDAARCVRQVTYSLLNVEPSDPFTEDSLMNFLVGHAVEEAWAQILTAAGAEYVREEYVKIPAGETFVTGRKDFDGIRLLWHGRMVELKSINSRSMGFTLRKGEPGKPEHRRQLNLYLAEKQIPTGYLVYVVKDCTKGEPILHAWRVDLDNEQAEADLLTLAGADELAKQGRLAAIPEGINPKKDNWPCGWCSWRKQCIDDQLTEQLEASIAMKRAEVVS